MNEILSANEMDSLSFIVAEENHVHNQRNDKAKFSSAGRFKDWLKNVLQKYLEGDSKQENIWHRRCRRI